MNRLEMFLRDAKRVQDLDELKVVIRAKIEVVNNLDPGDTILWGNQPVKVLKIGYAGLVHVKQPGVEDEIEIGPFKNYYRIVNRVSDRTAQLYNTPPSPTLDSIYALLCKECWGSAAEPGDVMCLDCKVTCPHCNLPREKCECHKMDAEYGEGLDKVK